MGKKLIQVRAELVDLANLEAIKSRQPGATNQTAIQHALDVAANAVVFAPTPEEEAALAELAERFPAFRNDMPALLHLALMEFSARREAGEGKFQILQRVEGKLDTLIEKVGADG